MKTRRDSAKRFGLRLAGAMVFFAWLILPLLPPAAHTAEEPARPKAVLALYWYGKDLPANVELDKSVQATLRSAPAGSIEYYAEYMDDSQFPGEKQALLFRDYLRQKYAGKKIDALIALSGASLNFLFKHRNDLFPETPIVFHANSGAQVGKLAEAGLTGVVVDSAYRNTLDLALKLHPATEQALIITATPERDKKLEAQLRQELKEFEGRVALNYLTDLPLDELIARVKTASERSIILYVRYSPDVLGGTLNSYNVLALVAESGRVPIYVAAGSLLGHGAVGGHAANLEDCGTRAAEIALRIVNGARPQDIPVVTVPTVPMFDWRQLHRWRISEDRLPPGSKIFFKTQTIWEQYKWRIIIFSSFCFGQALLIVGLFVQRGRLKRAEGALSEKELHLREAQGIAHVGSFRWEADADIVAWSDELCRIYGHAPGKLGVTYETYLEQVHPEHREQVRRAVERAITKWEPFEHEYRIVRPTGETRWVFAHGRPVFDAGGNLIALQGICQDITERKRVRESLRESEARNRAMLEAVPDLMFLQSRDGVYLDFHAQDSSALPVSPEQFLGKNMRDVLPPELTERFAKCFEDVAQSGQTGLVEYSLPIFGEERHFEVRVVNCDHDKTLSLVRDVTERKQMEQALRVSEEQARRTLVEQMLVGVAECDADGKFTLVNQRFCDITGYTEAELLEMRKHDIAPPDDLARIAELYRRLVETGESFVVEKRYRRKDGSEVWVNSNVSPVRNAQGAVVESVSVVIDITDRKRAEREREQLLKEAQAANRSKDEFLAVVSHELRNPLNAILGYTRLLRARTDASEIQETVGIIERNGRMQLQLIEDLLDSARIISGKLKLEVEPLSLSGVITAALDVVRPAAQAKGIELRSDLESLAGQITGDPNRLQQVVWNLLSNAIKFTPEGGRVELRLENVDHHVRITVKDTGKGIEPEFLPFVFDRFRQSDSSSVRRFGGLGLGLSLVKQLVELHGGTIEAASDGPGHGATFTVTLPQRADRGKAFIPERPRAVAAREARLEDASPLDQIPSLAGVRVLVVDDEEEARSLLTAVLGESGAQVTAVSSGVEALTILADPPGAARPDALILDINMPDEDGYQALERVRALEAERGVAPSARIPAIALTAMGRTEDRLKALVAGFQMHVVKPVEPDELVMVIASLIERLSVGRGV